MALNPTCPAVPPQRGPAAAITRLGHSPAAPLEPSARLESPVPFGEQYITYRHRSVNTKCIGFENEGEFSINRLFSADGLRGTAESIVSRGTNSWRLDGDFASAPPPRQCRAFRFRGFCRSLGSSRAPSLPSRRTQISSSARHGGHQFGNFDMTERYPPRQFISY